MAMESSKQPAIDADLEAIQQINFTRNLEIIRQYFFFIEDAKETDLGVFQGTVKLLRFYFALT